MTRLLFRGTTGMGGELGVGFHSGHLDSERGACYSNDRLGDSGFTAERMIPWNFVTGLPWKRISEAPLSGRFLLAYINEHGEVVRVMSGRREPEYRGELWIDDTNDLCLDWGFEPTHYVEITSLASCPTFQV